MLTKCSLDYIFRLAVEMRTLGLPWTKEETSQGTKHTQEDIKLDQTINGTPISKRGRPKRSSDNLEEADGESPKRRKPGRAKKSLQAEGDNKSNQANQPESLRSEGQNRVTAINGEKGGATQVTGKKGQGRLKQEIDREDEALALANMTQVGRRRPGRPRKTL